MSASSVSLFSDDADSAKTYLAVTQTALSNLWKRITRRICLYTVGKIVFHSDQEGLKEPFDVKNRERKISRHCPFKECERFLDGKKTCRRHTKNGTNNPVLERIWPMARKKEGDLCYSTQVISMWTGRFSKRTTWWYLSFLWYFNILWRSFSTPLRRDIKKFKLIFPYNI